MTDQLLPQFQHYIDSSSHDHNLSISVAVSHRKIDHFVGPSNADDIGRRLQIYVIFVDTELAKRHTLNFIFS